MSTSLKTEFLFLGRVGGAQVFLLFRPSTDQMTPNHIMKDNLLHSKSTDLNAAAAVAAAKSLQLCPTLCDPIDGSPPVSPVPGILQARTLEWVAISFPDA